MNVNKYQLSIVIPSRNEEFAAKTVENILANKRGKTEVIIVLDGAWANPPIEDHPDLTVLYLPEAIGQRAATNRGVAVSKAKYIMKIDSHSAVDEGFDVKLLEDMQEDWCVVPTLYNLHAFNWKCLKCGNEWYQGAKPTRCQLKGTDGNRPEHINPNCDGKEFEKVVVFKPRLNRKSEFYRFDTEPHFQYHRARAKLPESSGDIVETMSIQGSCFMVSRKKYLELNLCDEAMGSWGSQGIEVACKFWLSGGRVVTNRKTWYSHMFRTQSGFSFPYQQNAKQIANAKRTAKDLLLENNWPNQIYPFSWLLEKFYPLKNPHKQGEAPDWHTDEAKELLIQVTRKGLEFYKSKGVEVENQPQNLNLEDKNLKTYNKSCLYYTDNALNVKISVAVKKQILKAGLPIVSTSLKPIDFGKNIHMKGLVRGYEAYFKQIITGLENSDSDIIFFTEHDVLYHPTHFDFTPPRKDTFYYNFNFWRVRSDDGFAIHYDTHQVNLVCAYKDLLLEYYKKQYDYLKSHNFEHKYISLAGFEPGTRNRVPELSGYKAERFDSKLPCLDIRHGANLTASRWKKEQFRNQRNCPNWQETYLKDIQGWNATNDFFKFIASL